MKKVWLFLTAVFCAVTVSAAESASQTKVENPDWTFFNIVLVPGSPETGDTTEVYGLKLGLFGTGGEASVYGIDTAVCYAGTNNTTGIQTSLISTGGNFVRGLQFSIVNFSVKVAGLQLGIVNYAEQEAFQLGIVNIIEDSPVYCLPVINCRF